MVNTLLLRPLPYRDPGRLVMVWEVSSRTGKDNVGSPGNYLHWRELASSFEEMGIVGMTFRTTLSGQGDPEELPMQYVSASTFHVLGVNAPGQLAGELRAGQPNQPAGIAVKQLSGGCLIAVSDVTVVRYVEHAPGERG